MPTQCKPSARQPCPQRPPPAPHAWALSRCRRCVAAGTRCAADSSAIGTAAIDCMRAHVCGARSAGGGGGAAQRGPPRSTRPEAVADPKPCSASWASRRRRMPSRHPTCACTAGTLEAPAARRSQRRCRGRPRALHAVGGAEKYLYALVFIIPHREERRRFGKMIARSNMHARAPTNCSGS